MRILYRFNIAKKHRVAKPGTFSFYYGNFSFWYIIFRGLNRVNLFVFVITGL